MSTKHNPAELEDLKQRIDIRDLASRLGMQLRGKQARCYNSEQHKHGDKNFSLGLDINENRYKCFACGVGGSVIDLYMGVQKVDFKQALDELRGLYGLENPTNPQAHKPRAIIAQKAEKQENRAVYKRIAELESGLDDEAKTYLLGRGLTEETLTRFKLFSIRDYKTTSDTLKSEFSMEDLRRAGVVGEKDTFIFYKHRILVPFFEGEDVVFYQGRRVDNEQPKYLMPREVAVPLYNINTLKAKTKGTRVYVCEGVFDALIMEQEGYHAVAILGVNNFKPEWAEMFRGLEVVLALDNDEAGKKTTDELARLFYLQGMNTKTIELPQGIKDITDYHISPNGNN